MAFLSGLGGDRVAPVQAWFTLRTPRSVDEAANGSLGVIVSVPGGGDYHLVPRWRQTPENPWLTLYLETVQQRQRLGLIGLEAVAAGLKTRDIVIWAGDLDGDGKIDMLWIRSVSSAP